MALQSRKSQETAARNLRFFTSGGSLRLQQNQGIVGSHGERQLGWFGLGLKGGA